MTHPASVPNRSRTEIASAAAERVSSVTPEELDALGAFVGFDGFIDSIIRIVDRRHSMQTDDYAPIATIPEFAARVGSAAGKSTNVELVVAERRFGGNGPLIAGAMGRLGTPVTYIGAVGQDADPSTLDPIYAPFAERCREVVSVAAPGLTDALEFEDGKVMMGKPASLQGVTWDALVEKLGIEYLRERIGRSRLVVVVNWVMMGGVETIWRGLIDDVFSKETWADNAPKRHFFVDLCDPAKRTDEDLRRALALLTELQQYTEVTLGLNLAESQRVARVLGVPAYEDQGNETLADAVIRAAAGIRNATGLACVAVHPRQGAGAADSTGRSAYFDGPFTLRPKLSTGAGDHFNAGFCFGRLLGLPIEESLAVGCAVSGAYVRDAESPSRDRLASFLRALPVPEIAG